MSARDNFENVPQKQKRERDARGCRNDPHPPAVVAIESPGSRPNARHAKYGAPHNFIDGFQGHEQTDRRFVYAAVYAGGFCRAVKHKKPASRNAFPLGCPLYPRKRTNLTK